MPIARQDKDFVLPQITTIDTKLVKIERIFTNLLPLLKYEGAPITAGSRKRGYVTINVLKDLICQGDQLNLIGFREHPDTVFHWLESDFLSLVFRGNPDKQAIAAPLPMHLNTYKLRNSKHCRVHGVANQIFNLLYFSAPDVMKELRDYLFEGADYYTDKYDGKTNLDIETLLMMRILDQMVQDYPDKRVEPDIPYPLCIGQGRILGGDIARLLAYKRVIPRLVLINHIKNMMALHIGIYMLRLFQIVPDFVRNGSFRSQCQECPVRANHKDLFQACAFPVHIMTDMGENYRTHMAELARQQYNHHTEQLNLYVRSHITLKKLHEFAQDLVQRGHINQPGSLLNILALRDYEDEIELRTFFGVRIRNLMASEGDKDPDQRLLAIQRLGLDELETYTEMVYLLRQRFHQKYYTEFLDGIFQKNDENGLMRQGYGSINKRRYSMGSSLLETLVQIALLEKDESGGFHSQSILIDEFINWLQRRYGVYIGYLPERFEPTAIDLEALRENVLAFKLRLREIGFYTDLSDAYISQVVRPRYYIY